MNRKAAAARRRSNRSLAMGMAEQRAWEASGRRDSRDASIAYIREQMQEHLDAGRVAYLKVTCSGCHERMISAEPFSVPRQMLHEECGALTPVRGGGLLVLVPRTTGGDLRALLASLTTAVDPPAA